jgi:hypothetical protein
MRVLNLFPYFFEDQAVKCDDPIEFLNARITSRLITEPDLEETIFRQMYEFFELKGLMNTESKNFPISRFLIDIHQYMSIESSENSSPANLVTRKGVGQLMMANDCTVIPQLAHVLIENCSSIAERFSPKDLFFENMAVWGNYFGYNINLKRFIIDLDNPHFAPFDADTTHIDCGDLVPVLLSNDINDKCFTHWIMQRMNDIFQLESVIKLIDKPLFIFSYQPLRWQLESLNLFFGQHNPMFAVISSPVKFKRLIIPRGVHNQWFYGKFLAFLYTQGLRKSFPLRPRKIFISRGDASGRKISNERELYDLLFLNDFEIVDFAKLQFSTQISIIRSAEVVIFVCGSSGMNLLFANPCTKVGVITANSVANNLSDPWVDVCGNFGLSNVKVIPATLSVPGSPNSDLLVSLPHFSDFVSG